MIRRAVFTIATAAVILGTASPASARPLHDEPRYNGPAEVAAARVAANAVIGLLW